MLYLFALECEKKLNPRARSFFVLGCGESQQTFDSQLMWPTGKWPINVLCNQCFQLSEHLEQDIQTLPAGNKGLVKPPPMRIWSIEVQCGQENCGTLTKIYFQAGIGTVKDGILLKIQGHHIPCRTCGQPIELTFQSCKNVGVAAEICT
jgi:hypothetical protein